MSRPGARISRIILQLAQRIPDTLSPRVPAERGARPLRNLWGHLRFEVVVGKHIDLVGGDDVVGGGVQVGGVVGGLAGVGSGALELDSLLVEKA